MEFDLKKRTYTYSDTFGFIAKFDFSETKIKKSFADLSVNTVLTMPVDDSTSLKVDLNCSANVAFSKFWENSDLKYFRIGFNIAHKF